MPVAESERQRLAPATMLSPVTALDRGQMSPFSRPPAREKKKEGEEIALRIFCLESAWGTPTASQLRRLLCLECTVDQVVAGDRCDAAVYESPSWTANVTLRLERPPKESFTHIVVKWCDQEHSLFNSKAAENKSGPPEWWLASEELEEFCDPYDKKVSMEHKDVPVNSFAFGSFVGYNTFVAHFDSSCTAPPPPSSAMPSPSPSGKTPTKRRKKGKRVTSSGSPEATSSRRTPSCSSTQPPAAKVTAWKAAVERSQGKAQSAQASPNTTSSPGESFPRTTLPQTTAPHCGKTSSSPPEMSSLVRSQNKIGAEAAPAKGFSHHDREPSLTSPAAPKAPEPSSPPADQVAPAATRAMSCGEPPAFCYGSALPALGETSRPPSPCETQSSALSTPSKENLASGLRSRTDSMASCSSLSSLTPSHAPSALTRSTQPSAPTLPPNPPASSEGFKVTQCNAHFEHCCSELYLYFVDARKRGSTLYRLLVRYATICRIVLRKTSPNATTVYLHLLHPPLLYKVCAGNSPFNQCHREGNYLPQFNLSETTPWDRAVEFGEGPCMCSVDVLGRSRVFRLSLSGPRHWAPICNLIMRTRRNAQVVYAPVREVPARELKVVTRPTVREFGVMYALLSVWSESFQIADELAMDTQSCREAFQELTARAEEAPRALEESLFEIYFSLSQGKVFWFRTAMERLYLRYRAHRQRADDFTGSVIAQDLPLHLVKVRKVILTPTRRVYLPPQMVCKSRLLQHFDPEYALRIVVRDDDCRQISFSLGACKDDFLNTVIKPPLSSGLKIAGRRYVFLGCSTSQLRNHGVWFYAPDTQNRTAETIRRGIGDLSTIHSVPKFMARLGQAFSQSLGWLNVPTQYVTVEPDIRHPAPGHNSDGSRREYVFSDGIGRISYALLRKVHHVLDLEEGEEPCAVQIRYGGCKGMLLLDPTLSGRRIVFRESMRKFHSDHEDLYVLKTSKPRILYLNRPMITILEQSGIKAKVFLTLQNRILDSFIDSMMDPHEAAQVLCAYCALRFPYKELAGVGIDLTVEPFFRSLVRAINKKVLKELRSKARILVPPSSGRTMFGVLDESGSLEYGQVFVQYSNDMLRYKVNDPATILQGDVIVTKNPCMHPGDIRKLKAVNVPQLHHVRDCIVFPQKGSRPHPDEMAGSDLDGDEYSVLWYEDLIFRSNCNPMHYNSDPPKEHKEPIGVQDMVDFFCQYIKGDKIGLIANAHLIWADILDSGINSRRCRDLARKCAINLDFAKCGDLKGFQNSEKPPMYPDFMEKLDTKNTYCSRKVLGQLYRNCKKVELSTECLEVVEDSLPDPRLLLEGRQEFLAEAKAAYKRYALKMRALLKSHRIQTESEALSGAVSQVSNYAKDRNDPTDMAMVLESQVEHVVRRTRHEFFSQQLDEARENLKASAWYQVTYELQASHGGIQSFPWVVSDVFMRIVVSRPSCAAVPASRNTFSQRLGALLLGRVQPSDGDTDGAQQGETQAERNLLAIMYDWMNSSREFLFVKDTQELGLYKDLMHDVCLRVSRSLPKDVPPHKLVILCLRFACAWCLKIFQGGSNGELISKECRRRYRLGHLALITLNRLSMSGNLAYLRRAPEGCPMTELIRIYIDRDDEEFFLILRRYEDIFISIMIDWSGVQDIQCDIKKDRMDEWYLQLMVTGSRWALERLKEIVVYPSFREVLSLVFKREIAQP